MLLLQFVTILVLLATSDGFSVMIEPQGASEPTCFMEHFQRGEMMTVIFEVTKGGDIDIDVTINQGGQRLHTAHKVPGLKQTYSITIDGDAEICFWASDHQMREIELVFLKTPVLAPLAEKKEPVDQALDTLEAYIAGISADQRYLKMRENSHRYVVRDTNQRVLYWSIVELVTLLVVCLAQIGYLLKFFEIKRGI